MSWAQVKRCLRNEHGPNLLLNLNLMRSGLCPVGLGLCLAFSSPGAAKDEAAPAEPLITYKTIPEAQGAASKAPPSGVVRFQNGDILHGELVSIDPQKRIRWRNTNVSQIMEFTTGEVSKLKLGQITPARAKTPHNCLVRLANNDELLGTLTSLDADRVVLQTWYAGSVTFPRKQVKSIRPTETGRYLYEGPTGLEGWTLSQTKDDDESAWRFSNGAFLGRRAGAIARDFKLPDKASIDVEVAWRDFLQLTLTIYTESLKVYQLGRGILGGVFIVPNAAIPANPAPPQEGGGFYALQLNQNMAYLMTVRKNGEIGNSPMESIPGLDQKNSAQIGLRVNKEQKTISLLVDGVLVKTWQEPQEFAGRGTCMRFVQQGQAPVSLRNIRIGEWDGTLEPPPASITNAAQDFVQLKNQDTLTGVLQSIRDGKLSFVTSFGTLDIPLQRVVHIELATEKAAPPQRDPGGIRAYFSDRGRLTFQLDEWRDQQVSGSSPNFGKAQFDPAAFDWIEFNLSP